MSEMSKNSPNAVIRCDSAIKEEIKKEVYEALLESTELLRDADSEKKEVHVIISENGLEVFYPVGEIYGYAWDFVESVGRCFVKLKEKYEDIEIKGKVYEYEQISGGNSIMEFYCTTDDKKLNVDYKSEPLSHDEEDIEYDEDGFLEDVKEKLSYEEFVNLFQINKNMFDEDDYEDFIIDMLYDQQSLMGGDYDWFQDMICGSTEISKEEFADSIKILKERGIPNPEDYVLDE